MFFETGLELLVILSSGWKFLYLLVLIFYLTEATMIFGTSRAVATEFPKYHPLNNYPSLDKLHSARARRGQDRLSDLRSYKNSHPELPRRLNIIHKSSSLSSSLRRSLSEYFEIISFVSVILAKESDRVI
jgi:hypothetical protein